MLPFLRRPLSDDVSSRIRRVEDWLGQFAADSSHDQLADLIQNQGKETPPAAYVALSFPDLDDVNAEAAVAGNIPVFDGALWNAQSYILEPFGFGSAGATAFGQVGIESGDAARKGLVVKGAASQTANLQEWQDQTAAALARVEATGKLYASAAEIGTPEAMGTTASSLTLMGAMQGDGSNTCQYEMAVRVDPNNKYGFSALTHTFNNPNAPTPSVSVFAAGAEAYYGDDGTFTTILDWSVFDITTQGYCLAVEGGGENRTVLGPNVDVLVATFFDAQLTVYCRTTTSRGLAIRPVAAATGNQQEWQDDAGAPLATVSAAGHAFFPEVTTGAAFTVKATGEIDANGSAGTAGYFLKSNGAGASAAWAAVVGTPVVWPFLTKTSNYTITTSDFLIYADASGGSFTLTLPTAVGTAGQAQSYMVKRTDTVVANTVSVTTTAAQTIEGAAPPVVLTPGTALGFASNNSDWLIW